MDLEAAQEAADLVTENDGKNAEGLGSVHKTFCYYSVSRIVSRTPTTIFPYKSQSLVTS